MHADWIGFVEHIYDLGPSEAGWLQTLLDHARPLFGRGFWPAIATYRFSPNTIDFEHVELGGPSILGRFLRDSISTLVSPAAIDLVYRSGRAFGTLSEVVFAQHPEQRAVNRRITRGLLKDTMAVAGHTGAGRSVILGINFREQVTPTAQERLRWTALAAHLGAGLRLRRSLGAFALDAGSVEAIMDPAGHLQAARGPAQEGSARLALRAALRHIDRARTTLGRLDTDAALAAWSGLVEGRWSLIDHFDSDGKRFVAAIRNDPAYPDLRGLSERERQVAEFAGLGRSQKEIAYTLGLSPAAVSACLLSVRGKLGLASNLEIAAFFSPTGLRARLAELAVAGEHLLVGSYPLVAESRVEKLSEAERAVLAALLAGSSNADIARRRQTSERTVANQVQTLYRKLGVRSRIELASRLQAAA